MAFIAPIVAGAIGLGAIGTAILEIGISVGLTFLANKLSPKESGGQTRGSQLNLQVTTNADRQVIFGEAATAGSLVYWQLSGTNNDLLQMVIALADHECTSLTGLWIDGKQATINGDTTVAGYNGNLKVRFYAGTASQTADSSLVANSGGRWTSSEVGKNVCYAVVDLTYSEKDFPSGIPSFVFVVRGAKLYDPRLDTTAGGSGSQRFDTPTTWAYSDNPAVVLYNVVRGFKAGGVPLLGLNAPAASIVYADHAAAANACDEQVVKKPSGTENRYRCGAVFSTSQTNRDVVETILATMGGELVESGGLYRPIAGVARTAVASLTDDDLIVTEPLTSDPRRPRSDLTNAVLASFSDPTRSYKPVPLPNRTSSADETADGGIRLAQTIDLSAVTSRSQAQRIMELLRRKARRQLVVTGTLRARWFVLEPGDWITLSSARRGYSNLVMVVEGVVLNRNMTLSVTLREIDAAIDDWTLADEIDDNQVVDLASAGPPLSVVAGLGLAPTSVTAGASQRPGLIATWTPITDQTVTEVLIEYRRQGDATALERRVFSPAAGSYTWLDGVQSGVIYEARALPVTMPQRATTWSAWVASGTSTAVQIVPQATVATSVPPNTITGAMLSAQERLELSMVTAFADLRGSTAEIAASLRSDLQIVGEAVAAAFAQAQDLHASVRTEIVTRSDETTALARRIDTVTAAAGDAAAAVVTEATARVDGDSANAALINAVSTTVAGHTATISTHQSSIDGMGAQYALQLSVDGTVTGFFKLDGSGTRSDIALGASRFLFFDPSVNGGTPVPLMSVQTVNGSAQLVLNGTMIAKAIEAGTVTVSELTAITSNLGYARAGKLESSAAVIASGKRLKIDLDNPEIILEAS